MPSKSLHKTNIINSYAGQKRKWGNTLYDGTLRGNFGNPWRRGNTEYFRVGDTELDIEDLVLGNELWYGAMALTNIKLTPLINLRNYTRAVHLILLIDSILLGEDVKQNLKNLQERM